ncbi:MAG: hypothetical protein DRN06_05225 [Thermoprotei archaeon]|nr:MAG: hypothetical protein DRN06_05225 [Thermoprotei archaeon]
MKALLITEGSSKTAELKSLDEALPLAKRAERCWLDLTFEEASTNMSELSKIGLPINLLSGAVDGKGPSCVFNGTWCLLKLPAVTEARILIHRGFSLIFNDNFLLSMHPLDVHESEEEMEIPSPHTKRNMAYAVYQLADRLLNDFGDIIERVEGELSRLEDEVVESQGRQEVLRKVLLRKRRLLTLSKGLWQLKDAVHLLRHISPPFIDNELDTKLNQVVEEAERQIDLVEMYRVMVSDIINIFATTLSTRLNISVKELTVAMLWLTIIATVIGFPNTVATIFGIPTLAESIQTHWLLLLLLGSTIVPILWLKSFLSTYKRSGELR